MLVVRRVDRINAAEHHRMNFLEARQDARRVPRVGDGVAHLHLSRRLDVGREITGFAHFQFFAHVGLGIEAADFLDLDVFAGVEQLHLHARLQFAVEHADMRDDALVGVEQRVKRQRLQTRRARGLRRGNALHDGFQNFLNADSLLRARGNRQRRINRQNILNLPLCLRHVRVRQVNLVNDRYDFQILLPRQMHVGDGLRLHALRRIHDEQRAFARAQAARDFVGEIHVAGRVNQVQLIGLAVARRVTHRNRMGLDGDAAFALQIHRIEQLRLHVARGDGARAMEEPIRQRRLAVVNVGNDAEISYVCRVHL